MHEAGYYLLIRSYVLDLCPKWLRMYQADGIEQKFNLLLFAFFLFALHPLEVDCFIGAVTT
jgi:hypothetical protein